MTAPWPRSQPEERVARDPPQRRVHVLHETRYSYENPVSQSWQLAHLRPRELPGQRLVGHALRIEPRPDWIEHGDDYFGNPVVRFAIHASHEALDVTAESTVLLAPPAPDCAAAGQPWEQVADAVASGRGPLAVEVAQFAVPSPQAPRSRRAHLYARGSFVPGAAFVPAVCDLAHRIHRDFEFDPAATTVTTPLEEVFAHRRGVCQDFAHLMIACLRSHGLAARYVSGYIVTRPPPGKPRLVGADASHAWVSAYCPGHGWVDIDPTNDRRVDQDFVTLGWGRDFIDVTPLRGVILGSGAQELEARVTVTPVGE
jgi:transglutaminase-like putative cysteine protease